MVYKFLRFSTQQTIKKQEIFFCWKVVKNAFFFSFYSTWIKYPVFYFNWEKLVPIREKGQ
jgi:hypothetical protein